MDKEVVPKEGIEVSSRGSFFNMSKNIYGGKNKTLINLFEQEMTPINTYAEHKELDVTSS